MIVTVDEDVPFAVTLDGDATTVDCAAVAAPAVNVTEPVWVIAVPNALAPRYPVTVTDPAVVDVIVAVATPDAFVVHGPELNVPVPDVTAKNTD